MTDRCGHDVDSPYVESYWLPIRPAGDVDRSQHRHRTRSPNRTEFCTSHYTGTRITLLEARGGSGTSTIAAAFASVGRSMVTTELVTTDRR